MLQSKTKQFYYPKSQDSLEPTHMIDILKIHLKSLRYNIGKLTEAWRTPISYDSSIGSRDGCRPLPASMIERFLFLVAGFAFTSR